MERFKPGKILHTNTGRQITVMEFIDELVDVLDVDEILDDIVRKSASGRESKS